MNQALFTVCTGEIDRRQLPHVVPLGEAQAELQPMAAKLNKLLQRVHESLLRGAALHPGCRP